MQSRKPCPDRGYAWVTAFGCFTISFIMAGLARAAGVLYVAIIDVYGVSREAATTPFSIRYCVRNMCGPFVGLLVQRYGIKAVTTVGGILAGIGGALCFFAPDVFWITIFWGGIHGIGYGMNNLIHIIILNQYFDKYKGTALGLALSGDCFGSFAFPIVIEFLLSVYDVKGTFLILGGIALNTIPAALLLRAPSWIAPERKKSAKKSPDIHIYSQVIRHGILNNSFIPDINLGSSKKLESDNGDTNRQKQASDITNSDDFTCVLMVMNRKNSAFLESSANQSEKYTHDEDSHPTINEDGSEMEQNFMENVRENQIAKAANDIELKKDISSINGMRKPSQVADGFSLLPNGVTVNYIRNSLKDNCITVWPQTLCMEQASGKYLEISVKDASTSKTSTSNVMLQFLRTNTRPIFLLICSTLATYTFLLIAVITVIIDYASDKSILLENGKYLLLGFSVADLIGRLGFGAILDRKWIALSYFAGLTSGLMGFFVFVIPFYSNFNFMMICMSLCGLVQGGTCIMYPILIEHYMEKSEESVALGSLNFYGGVLMLPLARMIGFFRDSIGSYDGVFWTTGGLCILTGILWIFEPCILRLQKKIPKSTDEHPCPS